MAAPKPLQILFVDDNVLLGNVLVAVSTRAGYAADFVADGFNAWDRISKDLGHYAVVVTDHDMPGLSGAELVGLLREAAYPGAIVVHSGSLTAGNRAKYEALGVNAVLEKSSHAELLLAVLDSLCGQGPAPNARSIPPGHRP